MRRINPSSGVVPTVLALIVVGLTLTLACSDSPAEVERKREARANSFWVTHALSLGGPYLYSTREPVTLADGSSVVCVATLDGIWCKEAQ